jgi:pimeloyl-ACP methyl ester carboxylesterase
MVPVLAEIGEGPFVLVGHSFGGRVGVVVASQHPELVRELILTGVPLVRLHAATRPPLVYRTIRWLARRHLISPRRLEAARHKYGSRDYRNSQGVLRDVLVANVQETYEAELSALNVPVTFLWGADDLEVPLEVATRAAGLVKGVSTVRVLEGVGHFVPNDASDDLVDAAMEALRQ